MGSRGPAPSRVAGGASFWVAPPPVTRERAGEILGAEIDAETWSEIERAFDAHTEAMALIADAPVMGSYAKGRDRAAKALSTALRHVMALHGDVLAREIEAQARLSPGARLGTLNTRLREQLADAARALAAAQSVVRAAEPREMPLPTEAAARTTLARRLRQILKRAGLPSALSDRRSLPDEVAESDLTPFERLLSEAEIHVAETPAALAKWASEHAK